VILDGYEEGERLLQGKRWVIYYKDNDEEYSFRQVTVDFWFGYDTEDISYEDIEIGEYEGTIYIKNGQTHIQWQQDGYIFEIVGKQSIEALQMLAASVKPVEE
jgi:hypothetical protein